MSFYENPEDVYDADDCGWDESCDVVEMDGSQLDVNHDVDFYDC